MPKLLLTNAVILTMNQAETIYENGFIVVEGDNIRQIGRMEALPSMGDFADYEILDCTSRIVMPGMVNCHCHMSMIVYRSLADDMPDRLTRFMNPLTERTSRPAIVRDGTAYAVAEMLMSGITTIVDHGGEVMTQAEVLADMGMRGVLSESITSDRGAELLSVTRDFLEQWKGHPLVNPSVCCHAPYTVTDEDIKAAHRLAREHDVLMQMHLSEMVYEIRESFEKYGMSPVAHLDQLGILDHRFLAAHANLATNEDLDIFAARGVTVSHDPGANTKAAKDIAPVMDMQARGITVGLGTDGPMSNNALNILSQMSLASRCQKLRYKDRSALPCGQVVRMGTIEGAKAVGLDHLIGSLEIGKKADIVILETDSVNMAPIYDYYGAVVYSANASNVETTIVNGTIVVRNKRLVSADIGRLRANLLSYHDEITRVSDDIISEIAVKYDLSQKLNY